MQRILLITLFAVALAAHGFGQTTNNASAEQEVQQVSKAYAEAILFTRVYVWRNGRWLLLSNQAASLPTQP